MAALAPWRVVKPLEAPAISPLMPSTCNASQQTKLLQCADPHSVFFVSRIAVACICIGIVHDTVEGHSGPTNRRVIFLPHPETRCYIQMDLAPVRPIPQNIPPPRPMEELRGHIRMLLRARGFEFCDESPDGQPLEVAAAAGDATAEAQRHEQLVAAGIDATTTDAAEQSVGEPLLDCSRMHSVAVYSIEIHGSTVNGNARLQTPTQFSGSI